MKNPEINRLLPSTVTFDDWLQTKDSLNTSEMFLMLKQFSKAPEGIEETQLVMWNKMSRIKLPMLVKYWAKIEPKLSLIDNSVVAYREWDNQFGTKYHGLRHRETGLKHGLVQWNLPNGSIFQGSYKFGRRHGLYIVIQADQVNIGLYRDHDLVAQLSFDTNFNELKRTGKEVHLIDDLHPADFKSYEVAVAVEANFSSDSQNENLVTFDHPFGEIEEEKTFELSDEVAVDAVVDSSNAAIAVENKRQPR